GVADVAEASRRRLSDGVADQFLGAPPDVVPERLAGASPIALVPLGGPQLIVHGSDDDTGPLAIAGAYTAAARDAGDPAARVGSPGEGHFEHIDPAEQAWRCAADWLEAAWRT